MFVDVVFSGENLVDGSQKRLQEEKRQINETVVAANGHRGAIKTIC